jgi:hypothetical protein
MLFSVPFDVQGQEGGSSAAASESDPDDLFADEDLQDDDLFADEDLQDDDLFADEEPTEDSAQRDSAEAPDAESEGGALGATDAASDAGPGPELEEEGFVAGQRGPTEGVEEILVEGQTTGASGTSPTSPPIRRTPRSAPPARRRLPSSSAAWGSTTSPPTARAPLRSTRTMSS